MYVERVLLGALRSSSHLRGDSFVDDHLFFRQNTSTKEQPDTPKPLEYNIMARQRLISDSCSIVGNGVECAGNTL